MQGDSGRGIRSVGTPGVDRSGDLDYCRKLPDVRGYVVTRADRPVAVFIGRRRLNGFGRWIARARIAPGEQATLPLLAAFRQAAEGGHLVGACVPGPSPVLPVLLRAGFRIRDRDTFMASEPHRELDSWTSFSRCTGWDGARSRLHPFPHDVKKRRIVIERRAAQ